MKRLIQTRAWATLIKIALLAIGAFAFEETSLAAGQYFKVDYPASTVADQLQTPVTYTIWIPVAPRTCAASSFTSMSPGPWS